MISKLKLLFAAFLLLTMVSCRKNDEKSNIVTFKATLNGANQVPSNASMATGMSTLTYNKNDKTFSVVTTFSGLTPIMGHIHKAVKGSNGPVIFPFTDVSMSPINFTGSLSDAQLLALEKDSMYVNLHTAAFPGGEIRGQLMQQ